MAVRIRGGTIVTGDRSYRADGVRHRGGGRRFATTSSALALAAGFTFQRSRTVSWAAVKPSPIRAPGDGAPVGSSPENLLWAPALFANL